MGLFRLVSSAQHCGTPKAEHCHILGSNALKKAIKIAYLKAALLQPALSCLRALLSFSMCSVRGSGVDEREESELDGEGEFGIAMKGDKR